MDTNAVSCIENLSILVCSGCSGNGICDYGTPDNREVSCCCDIGWEGRTQIFTDVFTDVFTYVFTDVFTDVFEH